MIKLSDFIVQFLVDHGVADIFLVTGGGAIHIDDSIGNNPNIRFICNHHEQACAFGVEGYARTKQDLGVCSVTTGPGSTNAITGVISAWLDSIPTMVISGQVKRSTIRPNKELRQLGDQEINIIDVVTPITKYAVTVMEPNEIKYHLEKAYYLSMNGRPGPTWLNIPFDVQNSQINEEELIGFDPKECEIQFDYAKIDAQIDETIQNIKDGQRPVLLVGKGIHLANVEKEFRELVNLLKIPVITSLTGFDLIEEDNEYYAGRQGTIGQRRGNFVVQNADVLLSLGTRLNIRMISFNPEFFAREAKKIVVDIDPAELTKPTLSIELPIQADLKYFIPRMVEKLREDPLERKDDWMEYVRRIFIQYPPTLESFYQDDGYANVYAFFKELSTRFQGGEVCACANGFASIAAYQCFDVKPNQKFLINSGCASMGYGLPAAIGACVANNRQPTYCFEGDGSLQMNIQELQTIKHYNLPLRLFVVNNNGYLSIKETQKGMFNAKFMGSSPESGVSFPNLEKIANAYEIDYLKIENNAEMGEKIEQVIAHDGPIICEVMTNPDFGYAVKVSSFANKEGILVSRPLEDMSPLLPREELKSSMIIKPLDDEN